MSWILYKFYLEFSNSSEYNFQMMSNKSSRISTIAYSLFQDRSGLNERSHTPIKSMKQLIKILNLNTFFLLSRFKVLVSDSLCFL